MHCVEPRTSCLDRGQAPVSSSGLGSSSSSCQPPLALLQAVGDDRRLRAFFPDDSLSQGLLFACSEATPGLDSPLGALLLCRAAVAILLASDSWA